MVAGAFAKYAASAMCVTSLLASAALADTAFGAWSTGATNTKESLYAATINDSGALLGQYCDIKKGSCIWELGMATSCDDGHKYPILVNADAGSEMLQVVCIGVMPNKLYGYAFDDFDKADGILKKGGTRIGFAFPMQEGQFKVVRFLLNGATPAVAQMRNAAQSAQKKVSTRDEEI